MIERISRLMSRVESGIASTVAGFVRLPLGSQVSLAVALALAITGVAGADAKTKQEKPPLWDPSLGQPACLGQAETREEIRVTSVMATLMLDGSGTMVYAVGAECTHHGHVYLSTTRNGGERDLKNAVRGDRMLVCFQDFRPSFHRTPDGHYCNPETDPAKCK